MTKMGKVGQCFNVIAFAICLLALILGEVTLTYIGLFWMAPAVGLLFIDEHRRRKAHRERWDRIVRGEYYR